MKSTIFALFTSLTFTLTAQVPNWTQYTCDADAYTMYSELSKGKAVLLSFSNQWSPVSAETANKTEALWQDMMSENVKVFGFLHEDQDFNSADCDDADVWTTENGITYPTFINIEEVLTNYINKYTTSGGVNLPWLLLFFPDAEKPGNSMLAYSGNNINEVNHILHDQWLQSTGISINGEQELKLVKIIDQIGRVTEFKPNTPLIYIFSDGSTKKVYVSE